MKIYNNTSPDQWPTILKRPTLNSEHLEATVQAIMNKVKNNGDQALLQLTKNFDKVKLSQLKVNQKEFETANEQLNQQLKEAIYQAKLNIERFHRSQKEVTTIVETMPGVRCWRKSVAIDKVGLYIPGGTAPLFSTVLMLGIPAKIAACREIIICTPPQQDGTIAPAILFAAQLLGIEKVYKVGGAQAIAAMAYGTESIPSVDKIFGPGNQYVTAAKQQLNKVGIAVDLPAGPSEVLVLADQSANPRFVAADLLSQAEHGKDSQVVLVAFEADFVKETLEEISRQIAILPRKDIARQALENSIAIIAKDKTQALDIINDYAPEHLIIALENADRFAQGIRNAGSVFLGNFTPESVGDYASGTNHTLPTNGFANAYSGVSLDSFIKKITFQRVTEKGLKNLGPIVELMAEAEQLDAHKNAVSIRLKTIAKEPLSDENPITKKSQASFINALIRQDLRNFKPYTSAREEFGGQADMFLDANESPFQSKLNRYPDPLQKKLKAEIAQLKQTKPENIFLGNGSDEAIDLLIRLFCEPAKDSILTFAPTYGVYSVFAKTAGVQIKTLLLDDLFQPDLDALKSLSARNSKILFVCNPNNPTGSIIPMEVLEKIIRDFPGIVVIDEAYIDFADTQSCIPLIDRYSNLLVLQTFSKAWGLAGARLGMAFSNQEIINWLNKIKLPYNINELTQQTVLDRIKEAENVQKGIQIIKSERTRLSKALRSFAFVKKVFPSEANFTLVRVDDPKELYSFLLKQGIIVRDRSGQINCEGCLRISIGTPSENTQLINALKIYAGSHALSPSKEKVG